MSDTALRRSVTDVLHYCQCLLGAYPRLLAAVEYRCWSLEERTATHNNVQQ